jgi:hypothetical protein
MNIFFYSARTASCWDECSFRGCAGKCLEQLQGMPCLARMQVLPQGSAFPPPMDTPLRSGDLLLLHAGNSRELGRLLANREAFENYRIILILGAELDDGGRSSHLLNPRYIATVERGLADVYKVVGRLTAQEGCLETDLPENGGARGDAR